MLDLEPIKRKFGIARDGHRLWDSAGAADNTQALVEEVEELREVLAWYADEANYDGGPGSALFAPVLDDDGQRARSLLTAAEGTGDVWKGATPRLIATFCPFCDKEHGGHHRPEAQGDG